MNRGRGRGIRRDQGRSHPYRRRPQGPPRPTHEPFDLWLYEETFPQAAPPPDDEGTAKALLARHQELQLTSSEQSMLTEVRSRMTTALDNIIVAQTGKEAHAVDELRPVGSHRMGTSLSGEQRMVMVVVFKLWPTESSISTVGDLVKAELEKQAGAGPVSVTCTTSEFEVHVGDVLVRCLAAVFPDSWLEPTTSGQVELKDIEVALAEIRRSRWCDEHITQTSTQILIRILMDFQRRIDGFSHLTPWMVTLLAYRASMIRSRREALPIAQAFRRALQLLSSGLFLSKNDGIRDPCEKSKVIHVHQGLDFTEQEQLCCAAQTMLRLLSHGAHKEILAVNKDCSVDFNATLNCGGVIVSPSLGVYEKMEPSSRAQVKISTTDDDQQT